MPETSLVIHANPHQINLLHALAPTLEGLFSVTVEDGKKGRVRLNFDAAQEEIVQAVCVSLQVNYNNANKSIPNGS